MRTFKKITKNKLPDPARRIQLEIGDTKQPDFYPQFKTMHWDNEANFSIRLKENDYEADDIKTVNRNGKEVVEWRKGIKTARLYELQGFEDGGFEFEVELSQKPTSNVLEFTIQSKEFNFFYQPPLNQEIKPKAGETVTETQHLDKDGNVLTERPENVVGSYAVYHKSKANNKVGGKHYRTGKAFHIYRPFAQDAKGTKVWCDLHIDEAQGILTITIPQSFLDTAVYPVIVDPTFGYTSIGASTATIASDSSDRSIRIGKTRAYSDGAATVVSMSAATRGQNRSNGSGTEVTADMFLALNIEDTIENTHDEVALYVETSVVHPSSPDWHTINFGDEAIDNENYITNICANGADLGINRGVDIALDSGAESSTNFYQDVNHTGSTSFMDAQDNPWNRSPAGFGQTSAYSIYVTYTAGGGGAPRRVFIIS